MSRMMEASRHSGDARDEARAYFARADRWLAADLAEVARSDEGMLVWSRELVVFASAVRSCEDAVECDAWYVHLVCGELRRLAVLKDEFLRFPFVVFERGMRGDDRGMRVLRSGRVARLISMIK